MVEHWWDAAKNFVCVLCPICDKSKLKRYSSKGVPRRQHIDYIEFRKKYHVCELCGSDIDHHASCEACGVLMGPNHDHKPNNFRKHQLCQLCIDDWRRQEIILAHVVSWEKYSSNREPKENTDDETLQL